MGIAALNPSTGNSKKGADPAISPLGCYLAITRERKLRRFVRSALRPALGDGFFAGVEAHTVRAVGVQVAEQRALPAAEAVVADRYRQRYVDADHDDFDFVAEQPCGFTVAGEDAGAVAVFVVVDQLHGRFQAADADDAQHWAEDFVGVDGHLDRKSTR